MYSFNRINHYKQSVKYNVMNAQEEIIMKTQEKVFKKICSMYGFRKQKIDVQELKVTSESKPLFRYFEVPDVFEARNIMNQVFGVKKVKRPREMILGYCDHPRLINAPSIIAHFILINREIDEPNYIYTRGHEYGHLLWNLGETEQVSRQAKNSGDLVKSINDSEDFACLCGHMALYNTGRDNCSNWRGPRGIVNKVRKMQKNFDKFFLGI